MQDRQALHVRRYLHAPASSIHYWRMDDETIGSKTLNPTQCRGMLHATCAPLIFARHYIKIAVWTSHTLSYVHSRYLSNRFVQWISSDLRCCCMFYSQSSTRLFRSRHEIMRLSMSPFELHFSAYSSVCQLSP